MPGPPDRRSADGLAQLGRRLVRRALARKWLVLSLSTLATAAIIRQVALHPGPLAASVTFRIDEVDLGGAGIESRPTSLFREYVVETVLSHPGCLHIIRRFGLYPSELRRGERLATKSFLDDVELRFYRNFFLEERSKRSVMLTVRYAARDPEVAWGVVNEIATMIASTQQEEARQKAAVLMGWATRAVSEVRRRQDALGREQAGLLVRLGSAKGSTRQLLLREAALVAGALARAGEQYQQLEETRQNAAMLYRLEHRGSRLRFAQVDSERPARRPRTALAIVLLALAAFVPSLLVVGLTVAAFVQQIYDADDLRSLGIPLLGRVPPHAGWLEGTLKARLAGERLDLGASGRLAVP